MRLKAIVVVEIELEQCLSVTCFSDDSKGQYEAEEHFEKMVKESDPSIHEEDFDNCLEDGYYANDVGYVVFMEAAD